MAHCACCGGHVNIVARLTPAAGLQADWLELQTLMKMGSNLLIKQIDF